MLKFIVFSMGLAIPGIILAVVREITRIKRYNLRIKNQIRKDLLNTVHSNSIVQIHPHIKNWSTKSEWLLFNANSAIHQLYHDKNKLIFNEMILRSPVY